MRLLPCLLLALALVAGASRGATLAEPELTTLPVTAEGERLDMQVHVYRPRGNGPFPVLLFLHGRAPNRAEREALRYPIAQGHADWWLRRGFAVVAPLRPGYGTTGGPDREDTGARWRGARCSGKPDFVGVAVAARAPAIATYDWVMKQPWARKDAVVLEGHSLGGLAALATAAAGLPGVRGAINFSGGTAGNPTDAPGDSCRPDLMAAAYRELGKRVRVPSLWLYAENDRYWGAKAPKAWHAAYWSGGSQSELVMTAPVEGSDGHQLLMDGADLWIEHLDAFLRRIGLAGRS